MAFAIPQIIQFDIYADKDTQGIRWRKWVSRFDNYVIAFGIDEDVKKRALLLHCAGEAVEDIFFTLPGSSTANTYDETKALLTTYFAPPVNTDFAIFGFRQAKRNLGESIDNYHLRLRQLAVSCNFQNVDLEIKSQILQTCNSPALVLKALQTPNIDLAGLLKLAQIMESTEKQAKRMGADYSQKKEEVSEEAINSVNQQYKKLNLKTEYKPRFQEEKSKFQRNKTSSFSSRTEKQLCHNCGYTFPHQGGPLACAAKGKTCRSCGKLNHFSRCCRSRKTGNQENESRRVHCVNETSLYHKDSQATTKDDENIMVDEVEHLFQLNENRQGHPTVDVRIGNSIVTVIVDTGATVNIIDENMYYSLKDKIELKQSNAKILPYGTAEPLKVIGCFEAEISYGKKSTLATFQVIRSRQDTHAIVGYKTLTDLQIISHIYNISSEAEVIKEFPDLFEGVGKLKNKQVKLHINPDIKPVARPHRRVPFHLRPAVEKEIKQLLEDDIIEPVDSEGPTPWVSPIVIVPKENSDPKDYSIRICVDMREANKAIMRERHIMPILEEVIYDLNGSKYFSVLDLSKGYHQLELHPDSRYITTFTTHIGLFRYKRLSFGICSAAEVFQNAIRDLLQDIQRELNISDDLIVHGDTRRKHDTTLRYVLQRLRENGLTLNKKKLQIAKQTLVFYGTIFGANGISVDPKKVEALQKVGSPKNPEEVRSFLGLATYCSRFIPHFSDITEPLRNLTKKNVAWMWGEAEEAAIRKIIECLVDRETLAYFDPSRDSIIHVDASPVGLGAIFTQKEGTDKLFIIAYASKALSPVERRYSQTEREALAVVWAAEHFHLYIYGSPCTIITDHLPLVSLIGNSRMKTSARIERWNLRLQPYDLKIKFAPGKNNPADENERLC